MLRFSLLRLLWPAVSRSRRRQSLGPPQCCELEQLESRQVMSSASLLQSGVTARIINGSVTSTYPAVGLIGANGEDYCSGVLIAPQYVLTAGHCADDVADTAGQFTIGDKVYHTEKVFLHPNFNGNLLGRDSANDLAIYRLDEPVVGIAPLPISRVAPRVGQLLTLVGFGGATRFAFFA